MRFVSVLFLAFWQLTAIPVVSLLSMPNEVAVKPQSQADNRNSTVIYKNSTFTPRYNTAAQIDPAAPRGADI